MIKMKIGHIVSGVNLLVIGCLFSGCGADPVTPSGRYWNVVMAGNSMATITFGERLSPSRDGVVISGGSTATFDTAPYNFLVSGGGTTCELLEAGGTVIVAPGGKTGTIRFNGICTGEMVSNLQIILGNSIVGVFDEHNNYIVQPGRSVVGIIAPPGTTGTSTGNITY